MTKTISLEPSWYKEVTNKLSSDLQTHQHMHMHTHTITSNGLISYQLVLLLHIKITHEAWKILLTGWVANPREPA